MKKLSVLFVMLVLALVTASPASAQESVVATGVLEQPGITTYMYGSYAITDESSGIYYALSDEGADLNPYVGQRVVVYGTVVPGYESGQIEGGPPLLSVYWVEPAF